MGRQVTIDLATGAGSSAEFLMGKVLVESTAIHFVGDRFVLPDPVELPLFNGKAVHPDMAPSPDGPEPVWAYKFTFISGTMHHQGHQGRSWSEIRGVPAGEGNINYKDLPKFQGGPNPPELAPSVEYLVEEALASDPTVTASVQQALTNAIAGMSLMRVSRGDLAAGADFHTLSTNANAGPWRLIGGRTFVNQPPTVSTQDAVLFVVPAGSTCVLWYIGFDMIWWKVKTTGGTWGAWRRNSTTTDLDVKLDRNRGTLANNTNLNNMFTEAFNGIYGYNKDFTYPGSPVEAGFIIDRHSIWENWASGSSTCLQRLSNSKDVILRELEQSTPTVIWGAWRRQAFSDEAAAGSSNITALAGVYKRENGLQLYGKKPTSVEIAASLTKTLSLYVARKTITDAMLDNPVTVLGSDIRYADPTPTLADGDMLTYRDLIYLSALPSHNGATDVLARVVGETLSGTGDGRTKFIAKMNATVQGWGWAGAAFVEPTGVNPGNMLSPNQIAELLFRIHTEDPWLSGVEGTLTRTVNISGPNPRSATVAHSIDPNGAVKFPEFVAGKTGTYQGGSVAMLVQDSPTAPLACVVVMRSTPSEARYDEARLVLDGWAT